MSAIPEHLPTAEEFAALPHEGPRLELVRGEIVAKAPAFDDHGEAADRVSVFLGHYILAHGLGRTYAAETGFLVAEDPDTVRAPDFAFIAASRVPARGKPGWVRVIPDLVAEVVSSGDRPNEVAEKIQMWLDAGVGMVLVLYPASRVVEVHRPGEPAHELHLAIHWRAVRWCPASPSPCRSYSRSREPATHASSVLSQVPGDERRSAAPGPATERRPLIKARVARLGIARESDRSRAVSRG